MLLQHYNYLNQSFQALPVCAPYFNLFYNPLSHPTPSIMLLKFKFTFISSSGSHSQLIKKILKELGFQWWDHQIVLKKNVA